MRRAIVAMLAIATTANAQPTSHRSSESAPSSRAAVALGAAFPAYDRGDLDDAERSLAELGHQDELVTNRDYLWWLRGMVAMRTDKIDDARAAFRKLAKLGASRFAAQVPWRLADCAWAKGEHAAAARAYAKLIAVPKADEIGDVGTAMFRIAEAHRSAP